MNYFCKYCGTKATSIASLTAATCFRHPLGATKAITSLPCKAAQTILVNPLIAMKNNNDFTSLFFPYGYKDFVQSIARYC